MAAHAVNWPVHPGSYLLVLLVQPALHLRVGALGVQEFPAGIYVYCGSALGAGGAGARVRRHLRGGRHLHWHIDFLLRRSPVREVWIRAGAQRLECEWSGALGRLPQFDCPVRRFGSSDCRCRAHLWRADLSPAALEPLLRGLPSTPLLLWRDDAFRVC